MLDPMPRHLFRHLRRCHTLWVLVLCAWLTLSSVAWAMPQHDDCCPPAKAVQHDHAVTHTSTVMSDSCCTHAPASVPESMMPHVLHVQADIALWQSHRLVAPQPAYDPPLRPPLA
jgi:hypothetical protein